MNWDEMVGAEPENDEQLRCDMETAQVRADMAAKAVLDEVDSLMVLSLASPGAVSSNADNLITALGRLQVLVTAIRAGAH